MSVHLRDLKLLFAFLLILAACAPSAEAPTAVPATDTPGPTPTPTRVPTRTPGPTWTPRPSATADPCTPAQIVRSLRIFMPYEQATLYYNDLGGGRVLEVWFVDPDLNARASQAEVDEHAAIALADALLLAFRLNHHVHPCLARVFGSVFTTVVDQEYQVWFTGWITIGTLAPVSEPTLSQFEAVDVEPVYMRQDAPQPRIADQPGTDACLWSEVRRMLTVFGDARRGLEGAHLFRDERGVHVWTQREITGDPSMVLFHLMDMAPDLTCLVPQPDWVWVTVVDHRGMVTLFGRVPGEAMRSEVYPGAIIEQFEVLGP